MDPVFTDPPNKGKRVTYDWQKIYALIRENPGEWLWLNPGHTATISTYNAVAQGSIKNFRPDMGVEMRTANNDFKAKPRTCDLYVRYNPTLDVALTYREREVIERQIRKNEKEKQMVSTVESKED